MLLLSDSQMLPRPGLGAPDGIGHAIAFDRDSIQFALARFQEKSRTLPFKRAVSGVFWIFPCAARFSESESLCRSEEHTSELQSLMRISSAVFCLKKKLNIKYKITNNNI